MCLLTEVKQQWAMLVLGWVTVSVPDQLWDVSKFLCHKGAGASLVGRLHLLKSVDFLSSVNKLSFSTGCVGRIKGSADFTATSFGGLSLSL